MRVTVFGNSAAYMVVPPRRHRNEGSFAEWLERVLRERGHDVVVDNRARWYDRVNVAEQRYHEDVTPSRPDVVVLQYGSAECQPNVLPTALSRHFTTWDQSITGWRGFLRRRVDRPLWRTARRWQRWAAARAGSRTWRVPPDRFEAGMRHLVGLATTWGAAVAVLDIPEPSDLLRHHLPGIDERRERYRAILRRIVADADDDRVVFVEVPAAGNDGLHLDAGGHRVLGERLADVVAGWFALS
jgi:lysophospholipase L1-like esterase